jgi:hypothetical protein
MARRSGDDIPSLINEYVAAVHVAAQLNDVPAQNRAADRLAEIHRILIRTKEIDALVPLLDHASPGVRGWAAAHLLPHRPELAEPVLASIEADGGLEGFNARWTLRTWRAGTLRFP